MKKNHKNTFGTPEGYFEKFNKQLFARIEAEEGDPNTDFLPKSDGFVAPEDYFEVLEEKVIQNLGRKIPKVISLFPKVMYYVAAAVAVLMVVALGWNWQQEPDLGFEDLASTDIETYFEDNGIDLSSYEIAETVQLDDVSISDISEKSFEEDIILDYLDENVDDLEDLELDYEEL